MNAKGRGNQRLKKWMKNHPRHTRVYALGWNNVVGNIDCDPHDMFSQAIWIGRRDDHYISGANIKSVVGGHTKSTGSWALPIGDKNVTDITEWFWRNFEIKGVCLFMEYTHVWVDINKQSRKCSRCGEHQRKTVRTETTRHRIVAWA